VTSFGSESQKVGISFQVKGKKIKFSREFCNLFIELDLKMNACGLSIVKLDSAPLIWMMIKNGYFVLRKVCLD